jgi:hypothetical protein
MVDMELSGYLEQFSILEIIQFLGITHKNGELRIINGKKSSASLFFKKDLILHAQYEDLEGISAMEKILLQESGSFRFHSDIEPKRTTLNKPIDLLVLEIQQRIDEIKEIQKTLPGEDEIIYLASNADEVPPMNTREWQLISHINGKRTIRRLCEKMGDEWETKLLLKGLFEKKLITNKPPELSLPELVPILVPTEDVREDRLYPPLLRTNLLLKAINGKTSLQELQKNLSVKESELIEDIRLLFESRWITFFEKDLNKYQKLKNEL